MKNIIGTFFLLVFLTGCTFTNNDVKEDEKSTESSGSILETEVLSPNDISSIENKKRQKELEEYNKTLIKKYEKYLQDTKIDILRIKKTELSTNEYNDFVKELDELNIQALEDYKSEILNKYQ